MRANGGFKRLWAAAVVGAVAGGAQAIEPNDDFASRTVLAPGEMIVSDSIFDGVFVNDNPPDTYLGAFDESGTLIDYDDDSSFLGDSLASALIDVPVNPDGSIHLAVTGFGDTDFDGLIDDGGNVELQTESGEFDLFVDVYNADVDLIASIGLPRVLAEGDVVFVDLEPSDFGLAGLDETFTYDALIDNTPPRGGDVDFFTFTGLPAGSGFEAEVVDGDLDTFLGLFDSDGELIGFDDDGGDVLLSKLQGTVPDDGQVHLAVSGYGDFAFIGGHFEFGDYTLSVVIPEPASLGLWVLAGLGTMGGLTRRRRARSAA